MAKKQDMDLQMSGAKVKLGKSDIVIRGAGYILITIYALACIIPFLLIIGTSFTNEAIIHAEGVQLIPKGFSLEAYQMVTKNGNIWKSYILTIVMTGVGTFLGLSIISMTGYALQRKDFPFRNAISFYIYFTSLFSAGLAPYYLLMTQTYHLKDSYLAVLLPLMMSPWLIILMKNFVKAIPHEITESGKIDGAGDMKIFTALILPMLKPALATIGLFLALSYWNEWYQSSLFLSTKVAIKPLQYTLYEVVNKIDALKNSVAGQFVNVVDILRKVLKWRMPCWQALHHSPVSVCTEIFYKLYYGWCG
ncbi:MAG: carbohydrate ABC transporter permease [Eisenbergiella sp.]